MKQISPAEASRRGRVLDLRTRAERLLLGAPAGSVKVSLLRHALWPDVEAVYLCQHAVRSKLPAWRGATEVAGGFRRWRKEGVPFVGGGRH